MDKVELKRVKPFYKLVLILKSDPIYDLNDFEVLESKSPFPKICLDSIAQDMAAIVLVILKPLPQASAADSTLISDIKIEIPDDTVSESFSSDDGEEFK